LLRFSLPASSLLVTQNPINSTICSLPFAPTFLWWPLFSPRSGLVAETQMCLCLLVTRIRAIIDGRQNALCARDVRPARGLSISQSADSHHERFS
jgi:hypothetical protein